mmetsp:Transcript_24084/g.66760  ORF Transcript_24084/g.66760 Transcript_24084/m.66760 type:complete len:990 (+) Transcript_24084:417-3386(+)
MSSSDDNNNIADSGDITPTDHSENRVDTPNPNDVLCGRGGNINSHTGNEQFRKLVEKRKRVYLTARFKREKRLIASSIVNEIRAMKPPGRFLARKGSMKDDSGFWYDIGDEKARDKTSQALRENAPSIRAEIETEINQQRAEMRRQETAADPPPPASAKTSPNESPSYPSPPMGHHHPGSHVHHGHPLPPPAHPVHSYNPHQSHYTQQYYDYYYHYYGYGAPPPPAPPGYTSSGAPQEGTPHPPHPPGFPHANPPHPYWTTQSTTPNTNTNAAGSTPPPPPVPPASSHPMGAMSTNAVVSLSPPPHASRANGMHPNPNPTPKTDGKPIPMVADHAAATASMSSTAHPQHSYKARNQEEEDRRLAIALQNEENAKAFEDRNRRFGSDRRSSRSTAYCAPGYRPRLLNDSVEAPSESHGSTPNRKKRPPMSASHFFASTHSHNRERANSGSNTMGGNPFHNETPKASTPTNVNMGSDPNVRMDHEDQYEMNLKPPAAVNPKGRHEHSTANVDNNHGIDHNHDFSISSFSTKGRTEFKDDSEFSLFGEGGTVIPPSNANSTGSFSRVRNIFAGTPPNTAKQSDNSNNQFNPIALDQSDRNHRQQQHQPQLNGSRNNVNSNRQGHDDYDHNQQHQQQQNHQESSLLSQVASHILGNLGVGGSTWNENNNSSDKQEHHHRRSSDEGEMEMELGQEVIMDVRDESSSMPPPIKRGNGTQIDWPSRTGCHTWIPDSMVDTTGSCNFGHDDNSRDEDVNHQPAPMPHHQHQNNQEHQHQHQHHRHRHANDHSLMRQSSYSRADISPINSMDMDFSHSSNMGVRQRSNNNNSGGGFTSSSLMNVFDQKTVDPNSEELLPQIHRSVLQKVPSWDRNYRSRSPVSLGEISGVDEMDSSLIRVHSRDGKDKMFGNMVNTTVSQPPSSTGQHNVHQQPHLHQNHHDENHHHPQQGQQYHQPVKSSSMHGHHHHIHQDHHTQAPLSSQTQNYSDSREIDMDWD